MATPITHVVLTEKIFDKFFGNKTKKDFFIGTTFPDVRNLGVIDREETHYADLRLGDLLNDDSFTLGLRFHSVLDQSREDFIINKDFYSLYPKIKYTNIVLSLKFLEDKILYFYVKNWKEYINYLNEVLQKELGFDIKREDIERWHLILKEYFKKQPDSEQITNLLLEAKFEADRIDKINQNINILEKDKRVIGIIEDLYRNFEDLILKNPTKSQYKINRSG